MELFDTLMWPMNLQLFAADAGEGGAGGTNPDTGGTGGQDPNAGGNDGGTGTKVQFTPEQQAAIDAIIAERVSRANRSAAKAALEARAKELGYESVEEMEAALREHKKAQDAQKTEAQKLQEALEAEKTKATQAAERAKRALIKAAFAEQAIAANLVSVDDAFALADLSGVEVKDDGTVEGVKEAVEQLVKAKPYLVKQTGGSGASGGGNPPRGGQQPDNDAERGRQMAMQRNQAAQMQAAGFDPWAAQGGASGVTDVNSIAQAVAAAVAAALQGQGNK